MGFPTQTDVVDDRTLAYYVGESIIHTDNTEHENGDDVFHPDDMQFHISWDWLMPVISKCLEIGANVPISVKVTFHERIYHSLHTQDISFAYKEVVEFIKNQNN